MSNTFTPEEVSQILEEFFAAVGTRQYIGARYVPIFGRKDETSIEWDNSAPYEPLTIVLYQGNSYTSRQYVPAGVEINNQEFWANTGNYNAQVEQYRQEVTNAINRIDGLAERQTTLEGVIPSTDFSAENTVKDYIDGLNTARVTDIADVKAVLPFTAFSATNTVATAIDAAEGKNIVAIGDSYGEGYTPDGTVTSWISFFENAVEAYDYSLFSNALGGAGFWRDDSEKRFATLITELASEMSATEKNNVGCVIIGGGYNDRENTTENILNGMQAAKTAIRTNFPNVKRVLIFPFGMAVQGLTSTEHASFTYQSIFDMLRNYVSANADAQLGTVVGNSNMLLRRNSYFSSDYVHPNQNGQFLIGNFVTDVFFGNANSLMAARYNYNYVPNLVMQNGVTSLYTPIFLDTIDNFFVAKMPGTNTLTFDPQITFVFDTDHPITLGEFADAALQKFGDIRIPITMLIRSTTSVPKRYNSVNGVLEIKNGVMRLNSYGASADGTGFLQIESIDRIQYFMYEQQINGLTLV